MKTEFEIQNDNGVVVGKIIIEGDWRDEQVRFFHNALVKILTPKSDSEL